MLFLVLTRRSPSPIEAVAASITYFTTLATPLLNPLLNIMISPYILHFPPISDLHPKNAHDFFSKHSDP